MIIRTQNTYNHPSTRDNCFNYLSQGNDIHMNVQLVNEVLCDAFIQSKIGIFKHFILHSLTITYQIPDNEIEVLYAVLIKGKFDQIQVVKLAFPSTLVVSDCKQKTEKYQDPKKSNNHHLEASFPL